MGRLATSLLHRPLFIKFSLLTTKQIISPATSTREKRVQRVQSSCFYSKAVDPFLALFSRVSRFSFLMVRWVDMLFWFLELYWFQKGAIEVDYGTADIIDCHLGWWVIVPLDLAQFGLVSLRHDSPRDNLNACVIYVHARKATHAKQNYLAGLVTKNKQTNKQTKTSKQTKKKNGDTVSHLHTWRQDGWLPQQISPFLILRGRAVYAYVFKKM